MCRLLIYKGTSPVQLCHVRVLPISEAVADWCPQLLTKPAHSIINQAFDSRLRVDLRRPINGDGFGVGALLSFLTSNPSLKHTQTGWYDSVYDEELGNQPCIFTSVSPVSCVVVGLLISCAERK